MTTSTKSSSGGYLMLFGLIVLLGAPLVIGHYAIAQAPDPTVHADAQAPTPSAN